jgi:thiol:disulfide interchange protein
VGVARILAIVVVMIATGCDWKANINRALGRYRAYPDATLAELLPAAPAAPLLLIFGGNWCVWCKTLDEQVAADEQLRLAFAAYQVLHVDVARNEDYNQQHNKLFEAGFPLLVRADASGRPLRFTGPGPLMRADGQLGFDAAAVRAFLSSPLGAP